MIAETFIAFHFYYDVDAKSIELVLADQHAFVQVIEATAEELGCFEEDCASYVFDAQNPDGHLIRIVDTGASAMLPEGFVHQAVFVTGQLPDDGAECIDLDVECWTYESLLAEGAAMQKAADDLARDVRPPNTPMALDLWFIYEDCNGNEFYVSSEDERNMAHAYGLWAGNCEQFCNAIGWAPYHIGFTAGCAGPYLVRKPTSPPFFQYISDTTPPAPCSVFVPDIDLSGPPPLVWTEEDCNALNIICLPTSCPND